MGKFRLNAPQTDSDFDVEGSMPFGGIGDKIENPNTSSEFNLHGSYGSNNVAKHDVGTTMAGSSNLVSLANLKDSSARVGIGRGEAITGDKNEDDDNIVMKEPVEAAGGRPSTTTRRSIRWLIVIGVLSVLLLVGLIAAVSVALTRDNESASTDASNGETNDDNSSENDGSDSSSGTVNPDERPSPDTTLGRIYNEGILRCGVPVEQRGFASTNTKTGRMEGFDADLCRAVAAGIFGPDNLDDRVEFVPVSAFERWGSLQDKKYDVLARTTTHTMEREVLEVRRNCSCGFGLEIEVLSFDSLSCSLAFFSLPLLRVTHSRSPIFTMGYNLLEFLNTSIARMMPMSRRHVPKPKFVSSMERLISKSS
jgi:hypothetical protein